LRDLTRDVLLSRTAIERGIFRTAEIETLLQTHDRGRRDCSARLWAIMCFELWMQHWADHPATPGRETA
ncbi:MAG: asparagine synthase-related protein, partial [Candidatus Rokuibacteriota bacterium]